MADFLIHQDHISQNLCENRDQPELNCGGKCILMQKLQRVENPEEQPQPFPEILQFEGFSFLVPEENLNEINYLALAKHRLGFAINMFIQNIFVFDIFHPPRLRP